MNRIKRYLSEIYDSAMIEAKAVFSDFGILLVAVLAILIYGVIYSYSYSAEILLEVPIAIVDLDQSVSSKEFIQTVDRSPNVKVSYRAESLEEAKELLLNNKVYGILFVKEDFGKDIMKTDATYFAIYADASYFLAYKQFFIAANEAMLAFNQNLKIERLMLKGADSHKAEFVSSPVKIGSQFLYNRFQGYGSFLMPAILILILQQTILLSSGMVSGKFREKGLFDTIYFRDGMRRFSKVSIVLGRSLFYVVINLFLWFVVMTSIYNLFDFPNNGDIKEVFALIIPYLLSSSFLGIAISTLFRYKESPLLYVFFTSVPFILISGISWPREGMNEIMVWISKLIPSTNAIDGFVRLQTMGANMNHIVSDYTTLWILCPLFFVLAILGYNRAFRIWEK